MIFLRYRRGDKGDRYDGGSVRDCRDDKVCSRQKTFICVVRLQASLSDSPKLSLSNRSLNSLNAKFSRNLRYVNSTTFSSSTPCLIIMLLLKIQSTSETVTGKLAQNTFDNFNEFTAKNEVTRAVISSNLTSL